jgi:hypothetical protein
MNSTQTRPAFPIPPPSPTSAPMTQTTTIPAPYAAGDEIRNALNELVWRHFKAGHGTVVDSINTVRQELDRLEKAAFLQETIRPLLLADCNRAQITTDARA